MCAGVYRQLSASEFKIRDVEQWYYLPVDDGVRAGGKVDRVDESGGLVRVIDYKTGDISYEAEDFYTGRKIQLPLYLLAASRGKRPAGAYYFPANIEFSDSAGGNFTLKGFMDASPEVVRATDKALAEGARSAFVDAYMGGKLLKGSLTEEEFSDFISYSALIARRAAKEMFGGNIQPLPYEGACAYCKMGGMCGFYNDGRRAPRKESGITCSDIARIVRAERGDE